MRATYILIGLLLGIAIAMGTSTNVQAREKKRIVTLRWGQIEDVVSYQIQIAEDRLMDDMVADQRVRKNRVKIRLKPGNFFYRVRGYDDEKQAGPWSQVEGFVINAKAPQLLKPKNKARFKTELSDDGIEFEWTEGASGTKYKFEVFNRKGVRVFEGLADDNELEWLPDRPGVYNWRVGYETTTGIEWAKRKFVFKVYKKAMANRMPATVNDARIKKLLDEEEAKNKAKQKANEAGGFVILRVVESIVLQTVAPVSADRRTTAELIGSFNGELRWRLRKAPSAKWRLSGSVNAEFHRQVVAISETETASFILGKYFGRIFYMRSDKPPFFGPFVHVGTGSYGVFYDFNNTTYRGEVSRLSFGFGGVIVFPAGGSVYMSILAMLRRDQGGTIVPDENAVDPPTSTTVEGALGFEAGFGLVLGLSERFSLEGRLRAQGESFSFGADAYSNTFIMVDAGIIYRL